MLARTAAQYGAAVATSTRVVGFLREEDRVAGVRVRDLESGREIEVRAKQTINATGVWIAELNEMLGGRGAVHRPGLQGRPPRRAAEPDQRPHRADHPDREEPAVHRAVGRALDRRDHRHRLAARPGAPGGQPGRHRLPAGPRQRAAGRQADPRRRRRGLRRAAAAAGRGVGLDVEALPRARRRLARSAAW